MQFFACQYVSLMAIIVTVQKASQIYVHLLFRSKVLTTEVPISCVVNSKQKSQTVIVWIFPTMEKHIATDKFQLKLRFIGSWKNWEKQSTEEIPGRKKSSHIKFHILIGCLFAEEDRDLFPILNLFLSAGLTVKSLPDICSC